MILTTYKRITFKSYTVESKKELSASKSAVAYLGACIVLKKEHDYSLVRIVEAIVHIFINASWKHCGNSTPYTPRKEVLRRSTQCQQYWYSRTQR